MDDEQAIHLKKLVNAEHRRRMKIEVFKEGLRKVRKAKEQLSGIGKKRSPTNLRR